jgi:sulfide dehydrogenase cytochrome subunit
MPCRILLLLAMTFVLLITPDNIRAAEVSRGAMLSNSCATCHGTDGRSPGAIPTLQGKSVKFISTALKEFRDNKRPSTVMGRHARGYSDEEIRLIAEHFGKKK